MPQVLQNTAGCWLTGDNKYGSSLVSYTMIASCQTAGFLSLRAPSRVRSNGDGASVSQVRGCSACKTGCYYQ